MFKNWWKKWALIDLLTLGIGTFLCVWYVIEGRTERVKAGIKDIWPNVAAEIVGVWISVRVIDALMRRREERNHVRDSIVGNINFMMSICQDLPPEFYVWRQNDLSNELMWFQEKRSLHQKLIVRYFTSEEVQCLDDALARIKEILLLSVQASADKLKVANAIEIGRSWERPKEVVKLIRMFNRFVSTGGRNQEIVAYHLQLVQDDLLHGRYFPADVSHDAGEIFTTMKVWIDRLRQTIEKIQELEHSVKKLRSLILSDM